MKYCQKGKTVHVRCLLIRTSCPKVLTLALSSPYIKHNAHCLLSSMPGGGFSSGLSSRLLSEPWNPKDMQLKLATLHLTSRKNKNKTNSVQIVYKNKCFQKVFQIMLSDQIYYNTQEYLH
jgi:hypothetical protein